MQPCKGQMQNFTFGDNAIKTRFNKDAPLCIRISIKKQKLKNDNNNNKIYNK